ncbi:MAG TPA: response regulator [Gemmataceae bacterium]|nr:response regulator [Gemmataceae bacterium]
MLPAQTEPAGLRVVVAPTNPITAAHMGMLLEMDGHHVLLAQDESSALEAVASHDPDVLLMDRGLPGTGGHDFAKRLRSRNAVKSPLLIEMGGPDAAWRRPADTGIDLHLAKPIEPSFLRGLLRRFQRVVG